MWHAWRAYLWPGKIYVAFVVRRAGIWSFARLLGAPETERTQKYDQPVAQCGAPGAHTCGQGNTAHFVAEGDGAKGSPEVESYVAFVARPHSRGGRTPIGP